MQDVFWLECNEKMKWLRLATQSLGLDVTLSVYESVCHHFVHSHALDSFVE